MSTYTGSESGERPTITLRKNPDGRWTARDHEHEVSAQGETRDGALSNLDAVVDALEGKGGRPPTDEELREAGIDPEENDAGGELPDVLDGD
jgi:NAD(P)H-hydrate repair Nnr-like enzyme with NAD(P)H-hydrate epimerase domain